MKKDFTRARGVIEGLAVVLRSRGLEVEVTPWKPLPPTPPPDPRETHPRCYRWVPEVHNQWRNESRQPFERAGCNDTPPPPKAEVRHWLQLRITQGEKEALAAADEIRAAHNRLVDLALTGDIKAHELQPARARLAEKAKEHKVLGLIRDCDLEFVEALICPDVYGDALLREILQAMGLPVDVPEKIAC